MAFICPSFVGLFEWVAMTFGLNNAGATYQHAMNLMFQDLIGVIMEVYIDDIVIKSAAHTSHLGFRVDVSVWIKDESTQVCF